MFKVELAMDDVDWTEICGPKRDAVGEVERERESADRPKKSMAKASVSLFGVPLRTLDFLLAYFKTFAQLSNQLLLSSSKRLDILLLKHIFRYPTCSYEGRRYGFLSIFKPVQVSVARYRM